MTGPTAELPLEFGADGLVPAVIQDASSNAVLMVGFMNREALQRTRETGLVHFWSRSRNRLWQKGETSGHVQHVQEIFVNCEENSLLIAVDQVGAVCHTGHPTCYYRRLEPDNSLTVVRDRWFDPADVYGSGDGLEHVTQAWWGAFEYLRDHDLTTESGTSRMLRAETDAITPRIVDELQELAGVLDGTHRHQDEASDAALEGGQVCYWLALRNVRDRQAWAQVRPDRALDPPSLDDVPGTATLAKLLRAVAQQWSDLPADADTESISHESFALVASSLVHAGVDPLAVISADLDSLRSRPYLAAFFQTTGVAGSAPAEESQP
ncbi:MAG TPA: phosphoribosyl-AMP cyclohydrolase [Thermomicrobiales bacterium]|nr:phosphoribosyl-AMP cyclohydrolase [Thermomicrobiales bacterium]